MSSEPDITVKDRLNYTKYARFIYTLCPGTLLQAFKWLYIGKSISLKDFQEKNPEKFPNITGNDLKDIKDGKDVSDMDVTLLYKLFQSICGLAERKSSIWYKKPQEDQEKPLEYVLHQLKEYRNDISHANPKSFMIVSDEMLKNIMTKLQSLCEELLVLSAKKAGIKDKIINKAVNKMKDDFQKEFRSEDTVTDEEFMKICRVELRNRSSVWHSASSYVLPRLQEIFHSESDTMMPSGTDPFPLNELLVSWTNEKQKIFVVSGDTGGGKTSLCSFLSHSWLNGLSTVAHLQDYDLLLPVQCGDILTRDLQCLLRSKIIPNSSATLDVAELLEFLKRKKILWVFDGWDEATNEAVGLLTDLIGNIEDRFKTHTALITSRPHKLQDLLKRMKPESVLKGSLLGFNQMEGQKLLLNKAESIKEEGISDALYREAFEVCERLISNINSHFGESLRNPLKLELLISVLFENPNPERLVKGYSLSQLYLHVKQALENRVLERLKKKEIPAGNCYEEQVAKWLKMLYKAAFTQMSKHEGLILNHKLVSSLKRDFDPVLADLCLSTFLEHRSPRYLFLHPTQINFYASFHILSTLAETADAEKEFDNIFEQNLSKYDYGYALDPCLGSYDVLQQCASTLQTLISKVCDGICWPHLQVRSLPYTTKQILWKTIDLLTDIYSRRIINVSNANKLYPLFLNLLEIHAANIFPQKLPMKSLAKLIHYSLDGSGSPQYWLDIIRMSNYDELLLREISYYIDTDEWTVCEFHLKAAMELMSYTLPCRIVLAIGGKLEEPNDLNNVLLFLAGQRIEVHLLLPCHSSFTNEGDLSNMYLDFLFEHKAKCKLTSFEGQLDIHGLQTLIKAKDLQSLTIKTKDSNAVKSLHSVINELKKLASFTLVLDMRSYPSPPACLNAGTYSKWTGFKRTLSVNLILPHIHATDLIDASRFVSQFCNYYKYIHMGSLSLKRALFFMKKLENVQMDKFQRWTLIHISRSELFVLTQI